MKSVIGFMGNSVNVVSKKDGAETLKVVVEDDGFMRAVSEEEFVKMQKSEDDDSAK